MKSQQRNKHPKKNREGNPEKEVRSKVQLSFVSLLYKKQLKHRKKDSARNGFSNLPKAIKDFLFVKRKQIRGTPKRKKRIEGKPIEKRGICISET